MTDMVTSCGSGYQVKLPNGNIIKSENKKALEDLLAITRRSHDRETRITAAWNQAVAAAGVRYREAIPGRGSNTDPSRRVPINWRQVEYAVGRVDRSEAVFIATLAAFEDPPKGEVLLKRIGCTDIRSIAEALSADHASALAALLSAHHSG